MAGGGLSIEAKAIVPKRRVFGTNSEFLVDQSMRVAGWAGDMVRGMADYPPQQPTSYVRTGNLGRGWRMRFGRNSAIVENRVSYTVWVQGFSRSAKRPGRGQTAVMRRRGWKPIDRVTRRVTKKWKLTAVSIITQRDRRLNKQIRRVGSG